MFFIKQELLINEKIRAKEVQLIGANGEKLGIVSLDEALDRAQDAKLDLALVSPGANPPVCKLVNYGKYRYEQQKKAKLAKKNQKVVENKEIQLTPQIGVHDMQTKAKAAIKFLQEGNKVKVCVRFRGRQLAHTEVGMDTITRFIDLTSEFSQIEKQPALDGRWLIAIIAPKKQTK